MLIAVLEKHGGLRLADQDIYASAVGGMRIAEPAADLAIALAVAGAFHDRGAGAATAAIGEISLSGDLRSVRQLELRVQAAVRRGANVLLVPRAQADAARAAVRSAGAAGASAEVVAAASIRDALDTLA
jgi:DNA repair protein RadA/Sms